LRGVAARGIQVAAHVIDGGAVLTFWNLATSLHNGPRRQEADGRSDKAAGCWTKLVIAIDDSAPSVAQSHCDGIRQRLRMFGGPQGGRYATASQSVDG
jgi:hypothetical protein